GVLCKNPPPASGLIVLYVEARLLPLHTVDLRVYADESLLLVPHDASQQTDPSRHDRSVRHEDRIGRDGRRADPSRAPLRQGGEHARGDRLRDEVPAARPREWQDARDGRRCTDRAPGVVEMTRAAVAVLSFLLLCD